MPIDAVLFDWDGVAVDSMPEVHKGSSAVLRNSGLPVPAYEQFVDEYEAPYLDYYQRKGVTASDARIREWYFAEADNGRSPMFPEFPTVVRRLCGRAVFLGIVSAHETSKIKERLERERISRFFGTVVGRTDVKDEAIADLCRRFCLFPRRVAFVGDLVSDIRDGKKAGVITIAFTKNPDPQSRLLLAKPDHVVSRHSELLKLVLPECARVRAFD